MITASQIVRKNSMAPEPGEDYPDPITGVDYNDPSKNPIAGNFVPSINEDNWLESLQRKASLGDTAAYEKLVNYYSSEASAKTARQWTAEREDNQYQRLMDDLQKAGVSPYILSGATPGISSSSGKSYSGSEMVSSANNKRSAEANNIRTILAALGLIIGATIRAVAIAA